MIDYQLVISPRRKTLSLQVKQGQVIVRAPHGIKRQFINDIVEKKSAWLKSKITEQAAHQFVGCTFTQGAALYVLGQQVCLYITSGVQAQVLLTTRDVFNNDDANNINNPLDENALNDDKAFNTSKNADGVLCVTIAHRVYKKLTNNALLAVQVKKQLEQWFKQQAQNYIESNIDRYIEQLGLFPQAINIRQYRARWGSCNSKGELSFNYLLMMTPSWVIDYVIIHEICHLKHLNHSAAFWQLVAQHYPRYQTAKQWLKYHQAQLIWRLN